MGRFLADEYAVHFLGYLHDGNVIKPSREYQKRLQ